LTYSLQSPPSWISNSQGTLSINTNFDTPAQIYSITVRVEDNNSSGFPSILFTDETFNLEVIVTNFAPTGNAGTCADVSMRQGETITCSIIVSDLNSADTLSYSLITSEGFASHLFTTVTLAPSFLTPIGPKTLTLRA